jgi:aspartyl-tRNA(Asn)/glutamyl-tRNA(Gln) amidotransferase subunit C
MSTKLDAAAVKKIAYLARLNQNPDQAFLDKYGDEIGEILGYVQELNEVDTSGIDPLGGSRTIFVFQLRDDEPADSPDYDRVRTNIINNFPNKQGNLLVVPGIFE